MLAGIISHVVVAILSALGGWLLKMLHIWWTDVEQDRKAEQDAKNSTEPLKAADPKDGKAIDDAAKRALDGI